MSYEQIKERLKDHNLLSTFREHKLNSQLPDSNTSLKSWTESEMKIFLELVSTLYDHQYYNRKFKDLISN